MLYPNVTSAALWLVPPTTNPSHIVVEYNLFRDMGSDAIDGGPATIVGNDFYDVTGSNPDDPRHTDAIQYDENDIIEGNYVYNPCTQGIAAYDGTKREHDRGQRDRWLLASTRSSPLPTHRVRSSHTTP